MRLTNWMRCFDPSAVRHLGAAMRIRAWCLLFVLLALPASAFSQNHSDTRDEQQLLALINQERAKEGVPRVEFNEDLSRAARKHTELMVQNDSLVHQFPGEESLPLRLSDEHVRCDRDGENVALDSNVAGAHAMLMLSPPHRANILSPQFDAVGIAVVSSGDLIYVTEDFAHVLPNYTEFEADAAAQQAISDFARAQGLPVPARKARSQLTQMACDMAREDKLESAKARTMPGVSSAVLWNAADLTKLPASLKKLLAQPLDSGYGLGVCFAPSVSHPGGIYWVVMVIY